MISSKGRCAGHIAIYAAIFVAVISASPFVGAERINMSAVFDGGVDAEIFLKIRLPRVLLGILAGGSLALVGAVFQVILRNPLATPYTLGVTGGAAVGAYLAIAFPAIAISFGPVSAVQLFSLVGAGIILFFIYYVARKPGGIAMTTLLLAGVTAGILCGAFLLLIRYLTNPNLLISMDRWIMGSLDTTGYKDIALVLPMLLPGLGMLFMQMGSLNHLSFGQEMAMGHGVDVKSVQRWCFVGGSLVTAAVVSVAGPIAFVGLLVPHTVRMISGYDHRVILPGSFLLGGSFLVVCDTLSRVIISPSQMPTGIITSLIGGVFFIYLLVKKL
jgi:iron complex transport system permease protein